MTTKAIHPLFEDLKVGDRLWFVPTHRRGRWIVLEAIKRKYAVFNDAHTAGVFFRFDLETSAGADWSGVLFRSPEEEQEQERLGCDRLTLFRALESKRWQLTREQIDQIAAIAQINLGETT